MSICSTRRVVMASGLPIRKVLLNAVSGGRHF